MRLAQTTNLFMLGAVVPCIACSQPSGASTAETTNATTGSADSSGTTTVPLTSTGTGSGSSTTSGPTGGEDPPRYDLGRYDAGTGAQCRCSADLKTVLCDGSVLERCGGETACALGECIDDPCEAAEIGKSSVGCEFHAAKTSIIWEGDGACFVAFIANTWDTAVTLEVEYDGLPLDVAQIAKIPVGQGETLSYTDLPPSGLPPGEVAILFLSREPALAGSQPPACPVPAGLEIDAGVVGTGRGESFHISSDKPVVAYQMLPYGGGSAAITSASLLLPTSAWDTNYVAVNAYQKSTATPQSQPSLLVVAETDFTEVTINPVVDIVGGPEVPPTNAGSPMTYVLEAGETLQINQDIELTGSVIESSQRIGLFGADSCMNVPPGATACDSAHQQIPPVRALGSEYVAIRYPARDGNEDETPPWRLVGVVDGTQLTWTPEKPADAPDSLGLGDVYEFRSSGQFIVASQDDGHPFYAASYMTGGNLFHGEGDAEWVNIVPTDQYLDHYVFFTDPTYSETALLLVGKPTTSGFSPVDLDCAGIISNWTPLGEYEYARLEMVTGDFESVAGCHNGRHQIDSDAGFGVTVWGWGSRDTDIWTRYVSYAYPAGAGLDSINDVLVPAG